MTIFSFWSSVKKEFLLLKGDKTGLLFMFLMPVLLVLIITIIQDSAFKKINENKISLLIVNHDNGKQSKELLKLLNESGLFEITEDSAISSGNVKTELLNRGKLIAIYVPEVFSLNMNTKAHEVSKLMLKELDLSNDSTSLDNNITSSISFYYDPIIQESYSYSLTNVVYSFLNIIEHSLLIEDFYKEIGINKTPEKLKEAILTNKSKIISAPATLNNRIHPNSTQQNVPAWTIFAMFFMVVSLGHNVVKERIRGSFIRLKTLPVSFSIILISKMIIYLAAAILQLIIIFSIGIFLFPYIDLPQLVLPRDVFAFITVVLITALSAVSYALMVGSLAKTPEQSNGFGAISIIIFAALGGILVPVFVMPGYLKIISNFSPMHWSMESFYVLFLKSGNWAQLYKTLLPLIFFIILCQLTTYIKLKTDKII